MHVCNYSLWTLLSFPCHLGAIKQRNGADKMPLAYSFNSWFVFRCLKDFNTVKHGSPESSVSRKIFCDHWNVTDAPLSGNIIWEHLSVDHESWWARALLINSLLFIFVLFLTTPAVVLTTLRELKASIGEHTWSNEVVVGVECLHRKIPKISPALYKPPNISPSNS